MVLYYYNKYETNLSYQKEIGTNKLSMTDPYRTPLARASTYYKNYSENLVTGTFTLFGSVRRLVGENPVPGEFVYVSAGWLRELLPGTNIISGVTYHQYRDITLEEIRIKGTLLEENIIAEENEFPSNGIVSENGVFFWYVRGEPAWSPPNFQSKIDGTIRETEMAWVKVDGQLREVDKVWTKVNNALREV